MATNGPDENAVREAFQAVANAGEEMAVHKAGVIMELRSILTPEQLGPPHTACRR
jgi:Spy/CpxP family protein refolding chaperone